MKFKQTLRKAVMAGAIGLICSGAAHATANGLSGPSARAAEAAAAVKANKGPTEEETREYFTDLEVVDQDGQTLRFYSDVLQGKTVLINFIYTTCKDACPLQTNKMVQVKKSVEERFGKDVFFVSISVDPNNDTPAALKEFATQQQADHPGWRFITGKPENVFHIIKKLGQYTDNTEMHSTGMILGNVKTRHWVVINPIIPQVGLSMQLEQFADEG